MSSDDKQVGGSHYQGFAISPFEFIHKNGLGFAEGNVVKYVSRWRNKGGLEDLKKARHYIDLLIEDVKSQEQEPKVTKLEGMAQDPWEDLTGVPKMEPKLRDAAKKAMPERPIKDDEVWFKLSPSGFRVNQVYVWSEQALYWVPLGDPDDGLTPAEWNAFVTPAALREHEDWGSISAWKTAHQVTTAKQWRYTTKVPTTNELRTVVYAHDKGSYVEGENGS